MKKGIHPENYRPVVFKDMSNEDVFITRSTINAKETIEIDGVTYPLVKVEISNTSHPFYTGKSKLVDTAGPVSYTHLDVYKRQLSDWILISNRVINIKHIENETTQIYWLIIFRLIPQ